MSNIQKKTTTDLFKQESVQAKFKELLGEKAPAFITSVLQSVASNPKLQDADAMSVYHSAAVAAILDLPINNSIGHAYIVPYGVKQKDGTYKNMAQFQLGYKGLKQLAMRSNQFKTMHDSDVREGEIKSINRLTGEIEFEWINSDKERDKKPVVGYVSYFKLLNGFESYFYMSKEQVEKHAKTYSMTYKQNFGKWVDDFDKMARKTVIKLHLNKGEAPLTIQMEKAIKTDQAVIMDDAGDRVEYVDHEEVKVDKESERVSEWIEKAATLEELEMLKDRLTPEIEPAWKAKFIKLGGKNGG